MIWEKLKRFTEVSNFKSFSEAARNGKLSQSIWSRDIHDPEKSSGFRLISRSYEGIKLTDKGKILLNLVNNFKNTLVEFKSLN